VSGFGGERLKIEDLLGRRIRYKGEEGRVVGGQAGAQVSVVVSIERMESSPRRQVSVPRSEWSQLEILD
jgi:hypothetical protein